MSLLGRRSQVDRALVDIMKNYLANKSFSRGVETLGAEASMVFVGNTSHTVPYMLKHSDLFDELPESYHDSAYLDRLHHFIPGWEVETIRGEMFSEGYGFVVDYIAEVLKSMRDTDFSDRYQQHFTLGSDISTRDRDGIHKTFSGLMKIVYPHGEATPDEIEELLRVSIEGRKRVKDQILRIDSTMAEVNFGYLNDAGGWNEVTTLEEREYPAYYHQRAADISDDAETDAADAVEEQTEAESTASSETLFEGHRDFQENQRGVSFQTLLLPYLRGATEVTITDPYIRMFHQARNLMELIQEIASVEGSAEEVTVRLITSENTESEDAEAKQLEFLAKVRTGAMTAGIHFDVTFDSSIHDRSIITDTGWKIVLGRGLDIFQYVTGDGIRSSDAPPGIPPGEGFRRHLPTNRRLKMATEDWILQALERIDDVGMGDDPLDGLNDEQVRHLEAAG
ncbi:MAG: BREX system Lon protease-like protein BrxL [Microthrixaceae bacterium]